MVEKNKRTFIYIDNNDFEIYRRIIKETKYFKKNLELFTCAVLVGKFIVKQPLPLKSRKDYIRADTDTSSQNFTILKCLAIANYNDVNILNNEDKLYGYCEKYANAGITKIYEWYTDKNYDFETIISKMLLEFWDKIDLKSLNQLE